MRRSLSKIWTLSRAGMFCLIITTLGTGLTHAFEKLTEAQAWIYDRDHLTGTTNGQIINYLYSSRDQDSSVVEDTVSLSIVAEHDSGLRDVEVDFLSAERHLPLPAFSDFRGNPVIIAMLEHIAQNMSSHSGGGALYFRNRIRDALASEEIELQSRTASYNDIEYETTLITFYPFINDDRLRDDDIIRESRFSIELSDDIPGSVLNVTVLAKRETGLFERTLSLE